MQISVKLNKAIYDVNEQRSGTGTLSTLFMATDGG